MPRLSNDFNQAIEEIPVRVLQKLVKQGAARSKEFYDKIKIQDFQSYKTIQDFVHT